MAKFQEKSLFDSQEPAPEPCRGVIRVAFNSAVDSEFDYLLPDKFQSVKAGQRVEVPFGRKNKREIAFCVGLEETPPSGSQEGKKRKFKLKRVLKVIDEEPLLDSELMELARWISSYYICPLGQVLAAIVPAAVKKGAGVKKQKLIYLAGDFQNLAAELRGKKQKQLIEYLRQNNAFDSASALEQDSVLEIVGCRTTPVKRLIENRVVKICHRQILKALPVIPEGMAVKNKQLTLNDEQDKALADIKGKIDSGRFGVTVLHGVTDSGKTEVYIRAIEAAIQRGKRAIVLLPEIALTAQTVQRFSSRFEKIAVMHSRLTAAQRNGQWQKIKSGDADVIIGARSAVFAPVSDLGLIVVDEEHEPSYKQDTAPRYNGRDVAIKRAQLAGAHCILGSATPALETLCNCNDKEHFNLISLTKRVNNTPPPQMKMIDLRNEYSMQKKANLISGALMEKLKEILARKEQAILLLNRRGYSNFVFCPSCKHTLSCRNCDVTLTFHKSRRSVNSSVKTVTGKHIDYGHAVCHYCLAKTLVPEKCPLCGKKMTMIGLGSQRLEEELKARLGSARIVRIDSDSMAGKDYYHVLRDFSRGKIDILAGTQMLAKGLHFPNVTLVGIISADTSLYVPDFRANERTFQLICQVAGRAGRAQKKGVVFVQTFMPEQPAIRFALNNDYDGFVKAELEHRKACNLPPFWRLAVVGLRDRNFDKLQTACKAMRERIDVFIETESLEVIVRGPMPAGISRIQQYHRMQIIVQAPNAATIQRLFNKLRSATPIRPVVKVAIDIDPVNLL